MRNKTYQPKHKDVTRNWHLVDVKGKVLGRYATQIARFLIGKHKVNYSAHLDMGDYVVVVNAKDVDLSGKKMEQKVYRSHSGYPGGLKEVAVGKLLKEQPEKVIIKAVSGMLPDNRLKRKRLSRLKVFKDENHKFDDKFKTEK